MGCLKCICCCFCSFVFTVVIAFVLLTLLLLKPRPPTVDLHSVNVTGLSASGSSVSATFDISYNIRVRRWDSYYRHWEVSVLYKDTVLGTAMASKLGVDRWTAPSMVITVVADSAWLDSSKVDDLNSDKSKGKKLKLDVVMRAQQSLQYNKYFKSPGYVIKEKCKDVEVNFKNSSGNSYFEHWYCKSGIELEGWPWLLTGRVEK